MICLHICFENLATINHGKVTPGKVTSKNARDSRNPQEMLEKILMDARKFQAVFGSLKRGAVRWWCFVETKNNTCFVENENKLMIFSSCYFGWFNPHRKICCYILLVFISMLLAIICYDHLLSAIFLVMSKHLCCFISAFDAGPLFTSSKEKCRRMPVGEILVNGEISNFSWCNELSSLDETPWFSWKNIPTSVVLLLKSHTWWLVLSKPPKILYMFIVSFRHHFRRIRILITTIFSSRIGSSGESPHVLLSDGEKTWLKNRQVLKLPDFVQKVLDHAMGDSEKAQQLLQDSNWAWIGPFIGWGISSFFRWIFDG